MTVQDLIDHLGQFEPETDVMFSYLDEDDVMYKIFINEGDIMLGDVCSDNRDDDEELIDDQENYIGPEVVLFNLNLD